MADPTPSPEAGDGIGVAPEGASPPGTPRWVKVVGLVAIVVVLLMVVALLAGGGHGPGRHSSTGAAGGQAPSNVALSLG